MLPGRFIGLNHEAIFYDPEALVQTNFRIVRNLEKKSGFEEGAPQDFIDALSSPFLTNITNMIYKNKRYKHHEVLVAHPLQSRISVSSLLRTNCCTKRLPDHKTIARGFKPMNRPEASRLGVNRCSMFCIRQNSQQGRALSTLNIGGPVDQPILVPETISFSPYQRVRRPCKTRVPSLG